MKRTLTTICLVFLCTTIGLAQNNRPAQFVYGDISYGFENNVGNTGLLMGIGYQRLLNNKFIFQADFQHYNSELINNNWQSTEPYNIDLVSDRSVFLSAALGYALIGNENKINLTIKAGPTLSYSKFYMYTGSSVNLPNHGDKLKVGLNLGMDFNIPIRQRHFLTIGFLSYSSDIPLQYLFFPLPVISYKIKL